MTRRVYINGVTGKVVTVPLEEKFNPRLPEYQKDPTRAWSRAGMLYLDKREEMPEIAPEDWKETPAILGTFLAPHKNHEERIMTYRCKDHDGRWEGFIHRSWQRRTKAEGYLKVRTKYGCKLGGRIINLAEHLGGESIHWLVAIQIGEEYPDRMEQCVKYRGLFGSTRGMLNALATGEFDRRVVLNIVLEDVDDEPESDTE